MAFIYYIFLLQACATATGEQAAATQGALPKEAKIVKSPPVPEMVEAPPQGMQKIVAPPPVPQAVKQPNDDADPYDDEEDDSWKVDEDYSKEEEPSKEDDDSKEDEEEEGEAEGEDKGDGEEPRKRKRHKEMDEEEQENEREEQREQERRDKADEKREREERKKNDEERLKHDMIPLEDRGDEMEVTRFVAPKTTIEPDPILLTRLPLLAALLSFAGILAYSLVFISKIFRKIKGAKSGAQKASKQQSDDLDFDDLEGALEEPATPVVRKMVQSQEESQACTNA